MKKRILFTLLLLPFLALTAFRNPDDDFEGPYLTHYIVFAGASSDFDALDSTARLISKTTGIDYHNDLVFDKERGMIVPDSSDDDIYAGYYFPRRYAEERISIEMTDYYRYNTLPEPSTRMTIISGMFLTKKEAAAHLAKVKKVVPDAYVKKIGLYQGCMH